MTRLIDADAIPYEEWECGDITLYITNKESIDALPTVDAVPVRHGRWKYVSIERYACSVCGCEPWYGGSIYTLRYCPNCGARMDKE